MKLKNIYELIDSKAPFQSAMDFDNVGILVGDNNREVNKALIALDVTSEVIGEAKSIGAELIISHHPVIFNPLKRLDVSSPVYKLAKNNIAALCCHTNLDVSMEIGVNKALSDSLGLVDFTQMGEFIFCGELEKEMTAKELAQYIKEKLGASISYTDSDKLIKTISFCSGSGGDFVFSAVGKVDAFLTGEAKHHELIFAAQNNYPMFVCGHYHSEKIFGNLLKQFLEANVKSVEFILSEKETSPTLTV